MPADIAGLIEQYHSLDLAERERYRVHLVSEVAAALAAGRDVDAERWLALHLHIAQIEAERSVAWQAAVVELEAPDAEPPGDDAA